MTIAEALTTAAEGGYHSNGSESRETDDEGAPRAFSAWTRNDHDSTGVVGVQAPWLDPHFWRALGLALGWHEGVDRKCLIYNQWWRQPWHRFIDHLADGHAPETFFARVPGPQLLAPRRQPV